MKKIKNVKRKNKVEVYSKTNEGNVTSSINVASKKTNTLVKKLWSNFHFSLALRISLHYGVQLLKSTLLALLIVTLAFILGTSSYFAPILQNYEKAYKTQGEAFFIEALEKDTRIIKGEIIPSQYLNPNDDNAFHRFFTYTFQPALFKQQQLTLSIALSQGSLLFLTFSITFFINIYYSIIAALLLTDFLRFFYFLRKRKNLNKTVLKPITDISQMAATLSGNNLSNRINTAGTKNELKDLSMTINHMLDRIERSYNSQKQFVSDASHELRTPIAVIQGYVQMLNRWGKNDKEILDEGLTAIAQETESMKDLVENLLFLARHDKKTLLLEMESFDPCELVSALHRESLLVSPDYEYTFNLQEHCFIYADKNMIKQAMRILVDNAIKYSPVGSTIQLGIKKVDDKECRFSVTDEGVGIEGDEIKRIFNRFYRSDGARSSNNSGHGLGLSIARIIVNAHKGKMKVKSKPDVGSTFSIVLPLDSSI